VARTIIKADNLRKTYHLGSFLRRIRINALDDVTFEVKGDGPVVVSLIGESGSGKTTLAKVLLRLIDPNGGSLDVEGRRIVARGGRVVGVNELRHLVQPIFQNPFEAFNAYRKVDSYLRDTAMHINKARRGPEAEGQIEAALQSVGLHYPDVVGKYPNQFSGGELQRVSVARALIPRPKLIVADEPVSMIDASLRMNIVNLFRRIKQEYATSFLYITHDLATAYYISDFIVILYRGCVVEFGRAAEVLRKPLHPYTQLLLASVPHVGIKWAKREKMSDLETKEYGFAGCKFANRCPHVMDKCKTDRPLPVRADDGRDVYCHLYK
jgi:peptide/nickel transport system ATP-binding protein